MIKLALFDFCGTVVRPQTAGLYCRKFLQHERRWVALYSGRAINFFYRYFSQTVISPIWLYYLRNTSIKKLETFSVEFADWLCANSLISEVVERIKWHQQQGYRVILVSAGLSVYLSDVAKKLNIDEVVATHLEIRGGMLTGEISQNAVCYGEKKVELLKAMLGEEEIDWNSSYAYSDHPSDVPLLQLVGHPCVVISSDLKFKEQDWGFLNPEVIRYQL